MKGRALGVLLTLLLVSACGLETVPSLSVPPVNYKDSLLVQENKLSFLHDAGRYAGSPFLSYIVYYRIYPVDQAQGQFGQLPSDQNKLTASPTVSQLLGLGYQQMAVSASSEGTGVRNLELEPTTDQEKVSLNFIDFLSGKEAFPVLEYGDAPAAAPYLYRSINLGEAVGFGALRTEATARTGDTVPDTDAERQYEVDVFIAAYGLTDAVTEVYSSPVPWGVLRTIQSIP